MNAAQVGQSCTVVQDGSKDLQDQSRQCNTPWNLQSNKQIGYAGLGSGEIGMFAQDCDVTYWYDGKIQFRAFNGDANYDGAQDYNLGGPGVWFEARTRIKAGTRLVIEPGPYHTTARFLIKDITRCSKPQDGSHFLVINPALSAKYGKLVCATYSTSDSHLVAFASCSTSTQIDITELGNNDTPTYTMDSPYKSPNPRWYRSGHSVKALYGTTGQSGNWTFTRSKGGYVITTVDLTSRTPEALTAPSSAGPAAAMTTRTPDGSDSQLFDLVPVPYNWTDPTTAKP